ncbi:unnamed protein product [Ambrosiozyma monospora]|uniref:Unnamed protein product n=1 Tax=Ambrosiozyma monospora TaxID=43982 RepID=A0A9W7DFN5_AMBMO|nr:unnamed protein product [Ambrosiozyma monospora]
MFICSQDRARQRKSRSQNKRNVVNKLKTEDCRSKISLNYDFVTGIIQISYSHKHHEPFSWKKEPTAEEIYLEQAHHFSQLAAVQNRIHQQQQQQQQQHGQPQEQQLVESTLDEHVERSSAAAAAAAAAEAAAHLSKEVSQMLENADAEQLDTNQMIELATAAAQSTGAQNPNRGDVSVSVSVSEAYQQIMQQQHQQQLQREQQEAEQHQHEHQQDVKTPTEGQYDPQLETEDVPGNVNGVSASEVGELLSES